MKWKKGIAAVVSLLFSASLLTACSGGGDKKTSANPAPADAWVIGGNFELSGGQATFGKAAVNGAQLVFDEVNAKGGINGKQIKFVALDNKSEATESTNVASKLINQEKAVAILGCTTSGDTLGMVQLAMDKKIPVLSTSATNPKVTVDEKTNKTNDYIFRACFIDPFQGTVMANFSLNNLNKKTAAVLTDNQAPYAKGLAQFYKEAFTKKGGQIVADEGYVTGDQDFKAILTKIRATNPDVLYVPGYYEEVGKIVKQARELGMNIPVMGGDGWDSPKLVEIAGAGALNNTFFSNHYSSEDKDPIVQDFVKKYKEKYNEVPDSMAVLGYDGALILVDALKRAGEPNAEKIKEALAATKDVQTVTGKISYDEFHNPIKAAAIIEMKDGKQTFKDKVQP
ncbi:ABC transporter substrate-binding protein [Heliobacterium chlorum]|uniref:ABC transporter substrate-binding protein n=1 Tax=Heliobacterium chlorum TaxID=2698 RepID=A0ABR7SWW0_HELCL|nr:ABC transporter substrate-binding protein [Heliobacterium chlorum]MBC9783034.1 ABC transporter substrate-binding protein [Heliobacterium chlorum]